MGEALRKIPLAADTPVLVTRTRAPLYADYITARSIARPRQFIHLRWAARQLLALIAVAAIVAIPVLALWSAAS